MPNSVGFLDQVTPVVISFNEAPNIRRCLAMLGRFPRVVLLDSGSTDGTVEAASEFKNVEVFCRRFDSFSGQWNYALSSIVRTPWILRLDSDYILTSSLVEEIERLNPSSSTNGYLIRFQFFLLGRTIRCAVYPPSVALHRVDGCSYFEDGHCQRLLVNGIIYSLVNHIVHDDRKSLSRWLDSQVRYSEKEAFSTLSPTTPWSVKKSVRRFLVLAPFLVPLYCLILRRGLFDGFAGMYYCIQRGIAESVVSLKIIERIVSRG